MSNVEIILTADGSHSLLDRSLNETYHSRHGALQESIHVFIRSGLDYFVASKGAPEIAVLEVGFGTGLNAFLTLERTRELNARVRYVSIEPHPVERSIWCKLNYGGRGDRANGFMKLHELPWDVECTLTSQFVIHKIHSTFQSFSSEPGQFDLVYFDAFAPGKQPDMWSLDVMKKVEMLMRAGGLFITYSAKGQLKRDLQSLGLRVESLAGPPGKKEITRAFKR